MRNIFLIMGFLIILTSCGGSGGGGNSSGTNNGGDNNGGSETVQDFEPLCSDPADPSHSPFHNKGVKSEIEYYLICNAEQLVSINNSEETLSQTYRIGQDIDLFDYYTGDYVTNPTNQFMIGNYPNAPFTGLFIGDHWAISNYRYINQEDNTYCGLFGYIKDASVYGIQLENNRIQNYSDTSVCASVVGLADNSIVYEMAVFKEEEQGVPERDWSFVRGTNVAGLIGKMNNSTLYESYAITELQNDSQGGTFSNLNISGITHEIENSSIVDVFYDGKIEEEIGTNKAGLFVTAPVGSPYIEQVYFSDKISSSACFDTNLCDSYDFYYIDTSNDQYYFMDSRNQPLSNWNPVNWWFADSVENARHPWLD